MQPTASEQAGPNAEPKASGRKPAWLSGLLPEALGLGFLALVMGGVLGLAAVANYVLSTERDASAHESHELTAAAIAAALGPADIENPEEVRQRCRLLSKLNQPLAAAWIGPDGRERYRWKLTGAFDDGWQVITGPAMAAAAPLVVDVERPVVRPDGAPHGTIRLAELPAALPTLVSPLWLPAAIVAGVVVIGFGLLYRQLHRRMRPMRALQQTLETYASGVERELSSLTLSDSLGQIGVAWNQLIGELAEMRGTLNGTATSREAGDLVQRFESRSMQQLLDRVPIGVLRVGPGRDVRYANAAATQLLQGADGALIGTNLNDAIGDEALADALLGILGRGGRGATIDRKRGEGDNETTLRFAAVAGNEEGAQRELIVTVEDVTHLAQADQARDNFLYHVTHELRTPLTNIQAYAETLTKPDFDDEQTRKECYNVIISETSRLSRLVENILSISQLEVGSARMDVSEIDLPRLIRQMVQDNLGRADEKQIDLTLKLPPKVPPVRGDKERLSVLLNNLIGNALKYTPQGGRVDVRVELFENTMQIAVTDTGIGIAASDQAYVFEKFYRAQNDATQDIPGTGLGLAIAREVARLHGGDITLESEVGKGSTFTLELPISASRN